MSCDLNLKIKSMKEESSSCNSVIWVESINQRLYIL